MSIAAKMAKEAYIVEQKIYADTTSQITVKTLKIGTPSLTTVVVVNIKQFDFTMQ